MALKTKRQLFGQHFLRDARVVDTILTEFIKLTEDNAVQHVLEIGPGGGALTDGLLSWGTAEAAAGTLQSLHLSEMDRKLIQHWQARFQEMALPASFKVLPGDFLKLSDADWLPAGDAGITILSNLPYASGTAIVTHLATMPERIKGMVLMFQAEVAERLRAESGTKAWGSLSIWLQNRWDVVQVLRVAPGAFNPPPKVWSEVVLLTPRSTPRLPRLDDLELERMLKVFFQQRRKMLRSSLPQDGPWRKAIADAGIEDTKRPEQLGWDDWGKIIHALP